MFAPSFALSPIPNLSYVDHIKAYYTEIARNSKIEIAVIQNSLQGLQQPLHYHHLRGIASSADENRIYNLANRQDSQTSHTCSQSTFGPAHYIRFLLSLGLRVGQCLRRVDEGWVKLDYLFKRFGRRDSYDRFHQEFFISKVDWERLRAIVFVTAFLGIMIFLKKKSSVDINLLPMVIFMFRGPIRVTIVPMVLAEIFRSLSLCSRGYGHFKGSNLLLQIWVLEHFYQRHAENGAEADLRNKIRSQATRLSMWDAPNDEDGWHLFLTHLTALRTFKSPSAIWDYPRRSSIVKYDIDRVDDEPNEEMEEDPEEDPREPTEEMEKDPEEYSEHDPNLYDPRDGGVMHIEDEPIPIVEDSHSNYGSIGFDEREDSNN
ncbi:hypothetical protein KY289_009659 [Solanum tuberosum]|nr:hypothetical protein KY289_009659 [Solanum tuberosum]